MIVYHHSGQVKVQNRNWNLTLSVFWMMKIEGDPEAGQRRDRPTTQFAPVRLLPTRLSCHHVLLMSRSTGGFGAKVCHLGGRLLWRWPAAVQPRPRRSSRHAAYCSWSSGPWGNVAAGADVTLENPARTSQRYRRRLTAPRQRRSWMHHSWSNPTGWLTGSGRLRRDPKRVERHTQSPPKYHPNRPERSTATERPDANQKRVDDHVGEEDAVEPLPGLPGVRSCTGAVGGARGGGSRWAGWPWSHRGRRRSWPR